MSNFCFRPFTKLDVFPDGELGFCCKVRSQGNLSETSAQEFWNGERMREIRRAFLNGERHPACHVCWEAEDNGMISERLAQNTPKKLRKYHGPYTEYMDNPLKMQIRFSNSCNMVCRMCNSETSTSWKRTAEKTKDITGSGVFGFLEAYSSADALWADMKDFFPGVKSIQLQGGEPLHQKQLLPLLRYLEPYKHDIKLCWHTNLMVTKHPFYTEEYLHGWEHLIMSTSLDGPPGLNEYIRTGFSQDRFESNLQRLKDHIPRNKHTITLNTTIQALNVLRMPETFEWLKTFDFDLVECGYVVEPWLSVAVLPPELKKREAERVRKYINETEMREDFEQVAEYFLDALENSPDEEHAKNWKNFLEFNRRIDGDLSKLKALLPEFTPYIPEKAE